MRFKCRIGWHNWSKWTIAGRGQEKFFWQKCGEGEYVTLQKRHCKHCELVHTRTIKGHIT